MRNLIFLLLLSLSHYTFSQDKKTTFDQYPFQVVHAENVKLADGITIVGRYDYINKSAEIKLESGFLILMHHSEKLFEFSGDTLVSIAEVLNGMPEYLKKNPEERPDIYLFSKYRKPIIYYALSHCDFDQYFFHGYSRCQSEHIIDPRHEISLTWSSKRELSSTGYILRIKNIFDIIIYEKETLDSCVSIDLSKLGLKDDLFILEMVCQGNDDMGTGPIGIKLRETSMYVPRFCDMETQLDFLQAWYYLTSENDYRSAKRYLHKLNQKSNHPFYQNLVEIWVKQ